MENVLILGSKCFDDADATGVCARNLYSKYKKINNSVYLLGYSHLNKFNNDKGNCFYYASIKSSNSKFNSLKRCFVPNIREELVLEYYKESRKIIEEKKINVIVAIYFPLEAAVVLSKLKKDYPEIKTILYEVDSSTDVNSYISRLNKYHIQAYISYMKSIYKKIDYILIMKIHMNHVLDKYNEYKNKIFEMDVPALLDGKNVNDHYDKDKVNFIFAGSLDKENHKPDSLYDFIDSNRDQKMWNFHFYSRGNCEDDIKQRSLKDNRIVQHGYVSAEEMFKAFEFANVFLSNDYLNRSNSIPSKVFNYFSTGKPVIHFYSNLNDYFSKEYIDKYPLGLSIYINDIETKKDEIINFINNNYTKKVDIKKIKEVFYMNTPEYSINLIRELINQ